MRRRGHVEYGPGLRRKRNDGGAVDHESVGRRIELRGRDGIAKHVIGPGNTRLGVHRDLAGDQAYLARFSGTHHEAVLSQLYREPVPVACSVSDRQEVHCGYRRVIYRNVQYKRQGAGKCKAATAPATLAWQHHLFARGAGTTSTDAVVDKPEGPPAASGVVGVARPVAMPPAGKAADAPCTLASAPPCSRRVTRRHLRYKPRWCWINAFRLA